MLIVVAGGAASAPSLARGAGFELAEQSALAAGTGGAGVARQGDPGAVWYNPAALADGDGLRGGVSAVPGHPAASPPTRPTRRSRRQISRPPTSRRGDAVRGAPRLVGRPLSAPASTSARSHGASVSWPNGWWGRYDAVSTSSLVAAHRAVVRGALRPPAPRRRAARRLRQPRHPARARLRRHLGHVAPGAVGRERRRRRVDLLAGRRSWSARPHLPEPHRASTSTATPTSRCRRVRRPAADQRIVVGLDAARPLSRSASAGTRGRDGAVRRRDADAVVGARHAAHPLLEPGDAGRDAAAALGESFSLRAGVERRVTRACRCAAAPTTITRRRRPTRCRRRARTCRASASRSAARIRLPRGVAIDGFARRGLPPAARRRRATTRSRPPTPASRSSAAWPSAPASRQRRRSCAASRRRRQTARWSQPRADLVQ